MSSKVAFIAPREVSRSRKPRELKRHCDPSDPPKNRPPEFHSGGRTVNNSRNSNGKRLASRGVLTADYGLLTTAS